MKQKGGEKTSYKTMAIKKNRYSYKKRGEHNEASGGLRLFSKFAIKVLRSTDYDRLGENIHFYTTNIRISNGMSLGGRNRTPSVVLFHMTFFPAYINMYVLSKTPRRACIRNWRIYFCSLYMKKSSD